MDVTLDIMIIHFSKTFIGLGENLVPAKSIWTAPPPHTRLFFPVGHSKVVILVMFVLSFDVWIIAAMFCFHATSYPLSYCYMYV